MLNLKQEGKITTVEAAGYEHKILTEFDVISIKFFKSMKEKAGYSDDTLQQIVVAHCANLADYFM